MCSSDLRDLEQGGWVIEDAQGVRPVEGATVGPWTLVEPGFLPPTVQEWRSLADASLLFRVAGDHQATALVLRWGVTELDLGWAQPFWPLLLIARARGTGDGWLAMDTLVRRSGLRRGTLEIYLLRVRERLERAGLADADTLVEVRPGQRRLGLPADRVQESREGPPPG